MVGTASKWAELEMDAAKIKALVAAEKIPKKEFLNWGDWPNFRLLGVCECGLRLPAHHFLTLILEHFGVKLVNLVLNSITMLSVFVYLCEAYLGIPANLELLQYFDGMARMARVVGSYDLLQMEIDIRVKLICEKAPTPSVVDPQILVVLSAKDKMERHKKVGMEDRRDDQEVGLMVISTEREQAKAPLAKKRRLVRVTDKGGAGSSSAASTKPFEKFTADMVVAKKAKAVEATEALKHKAPKTEVPFYYDNKTFAVSTSRGFIKQQEKENWKNFISFVKKTAAPAGPMVEGSVALRVVETGLGHPKSQEA
uniref:Transposase (putative) gypsy type domain-containing protein n=1 Tax=Phyllostachys edulis TaxID=38705 RepID=D3IVG3_PHYED|nr:hypothetical protein [Phyllostachys edulis]